MTVLARKSTVNIVNNILTQDYANPYLRRIGICRQGIDLRCTGLCGYSVCVVLDYSMWTPYLRSEGLYGHRIGLVQDYVDMDTVTAYYTLYRTIWTTYVRSTGLCGHRDCVLVYTGPYGQRTVYA